MTSPAPMPDYSHLKQIDFHPEMLHPVLRQIARDFGAELRWSYKGGSEDGVTLFVSPAAVIALRWTGMEYQPAVRAEMKLRESNPTLFNLLVGTIRARFQRKA